VPSAERHFCTDVVAAWTGCGAGTMDSATVSAVAQSTVGFMAWHRMAADATHARSRRVNAAVKNAPGT
jgi:hypothetical protein